MIITRREFLQQGTLAAAAIMLPQRSHRSAPPMTHPVLDPSSLAQFVDPLPIPKVLQSNQLRPSPANPAVKIPYYRLPMRQFESKVHRDMKPTRFWGFDASLPGPTIESQSGKGILVEWANELPTSHFLPIDHNLHGAEADKPEVRTVVHMHGAKTLPESDGYPEDWYVPGKSAVYHYPNEQDAALLWYHDHALGINRLNVFAGLFGLFIVRDAAEDALNLPRGKYEIPLVLCDRFFDQEGQLYYPVSQYAKFPWVPEVFGNAILANGKLLPYLEVEPRKYRFRVLNAANGRFFHLTFSNGRTFHQIGTDQGFLPAPLMLKQLTLAPAERADLVVDFADHAGEQFVLTNDGFSPVMQFRVARRKSADPSSLPSSLRPVPKIAESEAVKTRTLMLAEIDDLKGDPATMLLNNAHWKEPITENPALNSVEIWNLMNVTDDSHPIHLHLVRFQILDRRRFDAFAYQNEGGTLTYRGAPIPPEPNEAGWKDTVRADPAMVTRIIIPFQGYAGRYVWHCHILEHEDNEMMRPYQVVAAR
ncbi:MAG TPA: multicopper oxidase [Terriglobales bacterium]|nr:multicopper oxidase [Terriglobales bacterium]